MADESLRNHVRNLLAGGDAHLTFDKAVADLPPELRGAKVPRVSHTGWRLVEHLRICQWDILEFSRNPAHVSPEFPDGYWPNSDAPPDARAWDNAIEQFQSDLDSMIAMVMDPEQSLMEPFAHGQGQTLLREALVLADHNAYHLGQLVFLRRCLGAWHDE